MSEQPNLDELAVVTEQGIFGDMSFEIDDPNVRKIKDKKKKDEEKKQK